MMYSENEKIGEVAFSDSPISQLYFDEDLVYEATKYRYVISFTPSAGYSKVGTYIKCNTQSGYKYIHESVNGKLILDKYVDGDITWLTLNEDFNTASKVYNIGELDLSKFDFSQMTSVSYMFAYLEYLEKLIITSFDIHSYNNTSNMFKGCKRLSHIVCKQSFYDWCMTKVSGIALPEAMQEGGSGTWEIID